MPKYEYKTVTISGKFKMQKELDELDKTLNDAADKGWEFVSMTSVGNNWTGYGATSGVLITFRREKP